MGGVVLAQKVSLVLLQLRVVAFFDQTRGKEACEDVLHAIGDIHCCRATSPRREVKKVKEKRTGRARFGFGIRMLSAACNCHDLDPS